MNTIPIKSWSGELDDRELQKLVPYMEKLSAAVRPTYWHFLDSVYIPHPRGSEML